MLRFYNVPVSIYGAKLHVLLRHKGLEFEELPPPGGYGSDAYKRVVPSGNVPAMIYGDLLLADSEAIAEYLEEKHPDPAMLPSGLAERALARQLSRFHDTRLEPELRLLFPVIKPGKRDAAVAARQSQAISARLAQLAQLVGMKERPLSIGDCGFPVTCLWFDALTEPLGLEIEWPLEVRAYLARLAAFPAVAAEVAAYEPVVRGWIEG